MPGRKLDIGTKNFTEVVCLDEPGEGGACHRYHIVPSTPTGKPALSRQDMDNVPVDVFAHVDFQNGPVKESGVNGCHQEDLLAIVIDRLRHFQAGTYACEENAKALEKAQECFMWLNHRTAERVRRGVEGTNVK